MKGLGILMVVIFSVFQTGFAAHVNPEDPSVGFSTTSHNQFLLVVNKSMMGAKVSVYSAHGVLLATDTMAKRRLKIDFNHVQMGEYRIVVEHDIIKREFHYRRK